MAKVIELMTGHKCGARTIRYVVFPYWVFSVDGEGMARRVSGFETLEGAEKYVTRDDNYFIVHICLCGIDISF